ncbi:MAG: signal peptidase II [Marinicaulis sp.]|nr:signal peptidase II [Marinicaulis sp.]NNE40237.1 signal peptidase II [Marinicaulis sp.]NNL90154.1 signal peptidase II [Marinicaulis sp.]
MRGATDIKSKTADWWSAAKNNKLFRNGLLGASAIAMLDQISKFIIVHHVNLPERRQIDISGIFDLTYVQNFGASFGMLAGGMGSRILLSLISTGVAIGLAIWLGRLTRPVGATGIAFVIGGALGNLYDRIAYGYVVDFLDFSGLHFPWVFNVADMAINVGVAFLLLDAWQTRNLEDPTEK